MSVELWTQPRAPHNADMRRNYCAACRRFRMWAGHEGLSVIPAAPETAAAYLAEPGHDGL